MNYERRFCVYKPENHGLFSNYERRINSEYVDFLIKDSRFYVRNSISSDGVIFNSELWQEVTLEQFFTQYENASIAQYKEQVSIKSSIDYDKEVNHNLSIRDK